MMGIGSDWRLAALGCDWCLAALGCDCCVAVLGCDWVSAGEATEENARSAQMPCYHIMMISLVM